MGHWLHRNIVEPGKLPLLLALTAFVLTFVITRVITRLIRAGKGPFGNIKAGDVHIHHVVPGVVLTVIGGFGAVASTRYGVGSALFAIVFGIGAGLVLDEFALILYLDDVYWTEAGRKSVEAVVLTAALVGFVGAIRLARPGSPWAKRFYRKRRHRARARSTLRAYHHDRRWAGPRRALQDWIGGKPDPEPVRIPGRQ